VPADGGAIFALPSQCEIARCAAERCGAARGLFLFVGQASLALNHSATVDCATDSAAGRGGLFLDSMIYSDLLVLNFTRGNAPAGGTAAAYSAGGPAEARFLTVTAQQGRSAFSIATEPFTVSDSIFVENKLFESGAILSAELPLGRYEAINCTFSSNSCPPGTEQFVLHNCRLAPGVLLFEENGTELFNVTEDWFVTDVLMVTVDFGGSQTLTPDESSASGSRLTTDEDSPPTTDEDSAPTAVTETDAPTASTEQQTYEDRPVVSPDDPPAPTATPDAADLTVAIAAGVGGAVVLIAVVLIVVIVKRRGANSTTASAPSGEKDGDLANLFMSQATTASFLAVHQDALIETVATTTGYDPPTIGGRMDDIDDVEW
jgi:hypothetical protein